MAPLAGPYQKWFGLSKVGPPVGFKVNSKGTDWSTSTCGAWNKVGDYDGSGLDYDWGCHYTGKKKTMQKI